MKMTILFALTIGSIVPAVMGQAPAGSIIHFEIENSTFYMYDCPYDQLGTNPNKLDHPVNPAGIATGLPNERLIPCDTLSAPAPVAILCSLITL